MSRTPLWLILGAAAACHLACGSRGPSRLEPGGTRARQPEQSPPAPQSWTLWFETAAGGSPLSLIPTRDGGVIALRDAGRETEFGVALDSDQHQAAVLSLDAHGNTRFSRPVGPPSGEAFSACVSSGGILSVAGTAFSRGGDTKPGEVVWAEAYGQRGELRSTWTFPSRYAFPLAAFLLPNGRLGLVVNVSGSVTLGTRELRDPLATDGSVPRDGTSFYVVLSASSEPLFVVDLGRRYLSLLVTDERLLVVRDADAGGSSGVLQSYDFEGTKRWGRSLDYHLEGVVEAAHGGFFGLTSSANVCPGGLCRMAFNADGSERERVRLFEGTPRPVGEAGAAPSAQELRLRTPVCTTARRKAPRLNAVGQVARMADSQSERALETSDATGSSFTRARPEVCGDRTCAPPGSVLAWAADGAMFATFQETTSGSSGAVAVAKFRE